MSAWPGKYIIGLTGNIATGKSVVRKMLEHLGAYGIDADSLGHRAIAQGAPGYKPVVENFGRWVVTDDGQIDRQRLARIVFADPQALEILEAIVHPLVTQAVDILIRRSKQNVIVIEAIKLIESELGDKVDTLWVTQARPEIQLARLMQKRGLSDSNAHQRINAQPPQNEKIALADVVIKNDGSFENTWRQVSSAWQSAFPDEDTQPYKPVAKRAKAGKPAWEVARARPREADDISLLINRLSRGQRNLDREAVMGAFGEKAFLILRQNDQPVGVVGWRVENLVACTDDVYLEAHLAPVEALGVLMQEVERTSKELQCEVSLLFAPQTLAAANLPWERLGYQPRTIESLRVRAWQEAAAESMPPNTVMLFKQLRQDRVLRPV
ncbi:MAG TPA: dephospho-CoA kinase [Anaerolineales bacterium]|nr:dephospho-CoA kinase [Anaerolineales bacterium]